MANIALVDDDENILTSLSPCFLEDAGHTVRTYNNGASALEASG